MIIVKKTLMIVGCITVLAILSGSLFLFFNEKNKVNEPVPHQKALVSQNTSLDTNSVAAKQYNEAIKLFYDDQFERAKTICLGLINDYSEEQVSLEEFHCKAGPAALYMLGLIAAEEQNYEEATKTFQEMVEVYPNEDVIAPDGGFTVFGITGAEGLINQMEIVFKSEQDYEKSYTLINQLKDQFGKEIRSHTTGSTYYSELYPYFLEIYLKKTHAPAERWEKEYRVLINNPINQGIAPDLLLQLGQKYHESNMDDKSIEIYNEVIEKFKFLTRENKYVVLYECYGADAYIDLINIYQKQNNQELVAKMKSDLKSLIDKLATKEKIESDANGWVNNYKRYYE